MTAPQDFVFQTPKFGWIYYLYFRIKTKDGSVFLREQLLNYFSLVAQQTNLGLGRLIIEVSTSHTIRCTHTSGVTPQTESEMNKTQRQRR